MTAWRCMEDGGSEYVTIEATSVREAAEVYACRRYDDGVIVYDGHVMRVIVLDTEASEDDSDERYSIVDVVLTMVVSAHGTEVPR